MIWNSINQIPPKRTAVLLQFEETISHYKKDNNFVITEGYYDGRWFDWCGDEIAATGWALI